MSLRKFDCVSSDCPEVQLDGWPLFSPDRQHLLVQVWPDQTNTESELPSELASELYLMSSDGQLRQPVGKGGRPFWLTEDTYGFVTMRGNGWELLTAVLTRNLPRFLFGEADLLAEIPVEERPDDLLVNQVVTNPTKPQELLLQARQMQGIEDFDPQAPSYLFKIILTPDLATVEQIGFLQMDSFSGAIGFSPDGRFIIIRDDYSDPGVTWYLLDQETGQTSDPVITEGYNFAWSPDGQWFIQDTENYLLLTAPAYDYQYFIPHGFGSCPQVILSVDN
jgi:hypothetical protein